MVINYLHKIGWFIGLVLLQVLILNNVHIAEYATPFLYIYLILKFESDTPRNTLMLWAFFLGMAVDIFSDTLGMNAAATVLLAFLRPTFLRLFVPRDTLENIVPGVKTLGATSFLKYLVVSVFVHHAMLLSIEFFSFAHIRTLLFGTIASASLTIICIMAMEGIRKK
ncbi:rod shape-determining protein MreD [Bacteroides sp. UBA939]|uniref:rod shape-determining protein MreD n=1 Tax=Bacteroides sp. UBA939 TaxID=1946092 RepID=UPI0025C67A77|nr:rod shape-determining protein MreD [Bacteroides sp. UBA939]